MNAKEYLGQAYRLDQRIDAKLEQVSSLNDLATKATTTITGMPKSPSQASSRLEATIAKIVDLQNDINRDIDNLVDLKRSIISLIKDIGNTEYQTILEKRYLCFMTWEQIAVDMNFSIHYLYKIHSQALDAADRVMVGLGVSQT